MAKHMITATCNYCNNPFQRRLAEVRRNPPMFCSHTCRGQSAFSEDVFWSKFNTSGECREWTGSRNRCGYGTLRCKGRSTTAHVLAWEITNKKRVPKGLCVCHSCDNPSCGNPGHLFLGTHQENMDDMTAKGRRGANVDKTTADIISKSSERTEALAARFNVSQRTIRNYRKRLIPTK